MGQGERGVPGRRPPTDGITPRDTERPQPDPYTSARVALVRFLGACSPNSIIMEAARDVLREQEARGLLERSREAYRIYRETERGQTSDDAKHHEFQTANREAQENEERIVSEIREKEKGKNGKVYERVSSDFWSHVFHEYRTAAETILPTKTTAQTMEAITVAAQTALEDVDSLVTAVSPVRKVVEEAEARTNRSQDYESMYAASVAILTNNKDQLETRMSTDWRFGSKRSRISHHFTENSKYFSVRGTKGEEGLYSVRLEAQTSHILSKGDEETDSQFKERTFVQYQQIRSEETLPQRPESITIDITNHLDGSKEQVYLTRKIDRKGKEHLEVRFWGEGTFDDFGFRRQRRLIKDILSQQLLLSTIK